MIRMAGCMLPILLLMTPDLANAQDKSDYNLEILKTVDWLATNKPMLGYHLGGRYSSEFTYGGKQFKPTRNGETMCVGAVYEVILRSLADAKTSQGLSVSGELLPASKLDGSRAIHLLPYIFQYKSKTPFPEYGRFFSAGACDAFVLFGIGQYVEFNKAKPGDFIYFNRDKGGGHATVFMNYLDAQGKVTEVPDAAVGFRYFSSQKGGTNGLGYRDAFFGVCPKVDTQYKKDCNLIKSGQRKLFSVARLHHPDEWFTRYSEIRIARFFNGDTIDTIYADEASFRTKAQADAEWAAAEAKKAELAGVYPWLVTDTGAASQAGLKEVSNLQFSKDFGPDFSGADDVDPEQAGGDS